MKIETAEFNKIVYDIVKQIPSGHVLTYGQIARLAGMPPYARMVGRAVGCVPEEMNLPCHRVVNSEGRLAPGWTEQRILLEEEGVTFRSNGMVNIEKHVWKEVIS